MSDNRIFYYWFKYPYIMLETFSTRWLLYWIMYFLDNSWIIYTSLIISEVSIQHMEVIFMSCVCKLHCAWLNLLETFLFPTLNDSDDSENSLARGSISHFLKDSLQETLFNGCHYSNSSILDMKYFCCHLNFPRRFMHLMWWWSGCKQNQHHF
jgi:hypothetical protein